MNELIDNPSLSESQELRTLASLALAESDALGKLALVEDMGLDLCVNPSLRLDACMGRPQEPNLVEPRQVPNRSVQSKEGRGMLLHALAHIEFNAVNLALDAIVRFAGMPQAYYRDWLKVAREEAFHHRLLCKRLADYGLRYGDYPAHDGLWQMAEKTQGSLLARMALVPRLLEARGLDVSPSIRQKLMDAGDLESADVLDIILRDEIGHVDIGNRWYAHLCELHSLNPIAEFERCLAHYAAPQPRSPFNYSARQQAGFSDDEIAWLFQLEKAQNEGRRVQLQEQ